MRRTFLLAALLLLFVKVFQPSPLLAQTEPTLIIGIDVGDVFTLDPGRAYEMLNLTIHNAVYDTLLTVPADNLDGFKPRLADRWEISDDGLTYTFHLHPGVTFSSGNPLTAKDVLFSWTRLKNLKANPAFYVEAVDKVEAVDDLTVQVTLKQASPAFLSMLTVPAMSVIDSVEARKHGATDAEDADTTDQAQTWFDQNSAGSGPFILTGWTPSGEVTMVRNEKYWGTPAKLAGVTLRQVNDSTTALQLLERGDLDMVFNLEKDLADQVKANTALGLSEGQSLTVSYLGLSPDAELGGALASQDVRQAIAYAVDYDGIADGLLLGYSQRPASILPLGVQGSDGSGRYERDLDKARKLMSDAGYADGLDLNMAINGSGACGIPAETIAAKMQADLGEIGIRLTADIMQITAFRTAFRAQKLGLILSTWPPDFLDGTQWSDLFSYIDNGPGFRLKMDMPTVSDLAKRAGSERDPQARLALYQQWQQAQVDEAVFVPLCQNTILMAHTGRLENFSYHPIFLFDFQTLDLADSP